MKRILSIVFLFALLATSCSEEELVKNQMSSYDSLKFTALFEENNSRTYVEEGNLLRWTEGDQIVLFVGNTLNRQYQFDGETGDNSGTFSIVNKPFGTGNDLDCHYAVYPYASDIKITESGVVTATLPAAQKYAVNSFGLSANTMVAVTQDTDDTFLKFRNVGGYLKLQLYGDNVTVKSITLKGNNNEKLAGKAIITPAYGQEPTISMAEEGTETITLDCGEGVKIGSTVETATAFWMVVPPTTFTKGLEVTITDMNGGTFTKSTSNEIVIERNIIKPMAAFRVEIEAIPNSQILYTYSGEDGVKPYRDQSFLDAEGNILTYTNEYADGKGVLTFDGVLATLGQWAFWDRELTTITLPNGLTKIEKEAFEYCTGLETVTLPNSLVEIEMGAFYQNSSISKFQGKFATEDGRCLISNGVLVAFASGCGAIEYTIPDGVTAIGDWAFYYSKNLTKIVIPNSVTEIRDYAFCRCESLANVTIPDYVTIIGESAFSECSSLTSITIPDNVTTIRDYAFQYCTLLSNVNLGNSITTIGYSAFRDCSSLTSITIPNSVTTIGQRAFYNCSNIIEFKGKHATENGYSLIVNDTLIAFASACDATEYTIPNTVTTIGEAAFNYCKNLISITIPNSVTTIGKSAFYWENNLKEIFCEATLPPILAESSIFGYSWDGKIYVYKECMDAYKSTWDYYKNQIFDKGDYPYNVTTIIYYTTSDGQIIPCDKLPIKSNTYSNGQGKMEICGSLKFIPKDLIHWYYSDKLTSITIPSSVTAIGESAFEGCSNLISITIPDNVTIIGNSAFYGCSSLTSITIPNSVTTVGDVAFGGCKNLTSVTIGDGVTTIGGSAFSECIQLANVNIGNSVTTIGGSAFSMCSNLTSITIPNSVTMVGGDAFGGCDNLTSVTIGDGVTTIEPATFIGCFNLKEFKGKFASNDGRSLIVNNAIVDYANASGTEYTIPEGVTTIAPLAFLMKVNLTSITIPNSVKRIEGDNFIRCNNLKEFKGRFAADNGRCLIMDNTIVAYANASGTEYTIPDGVTAIKDNAFTNCNLTSVIIPNGIKSIGRYAFSACNLSSVTIGENVTTIGEYAFKGCNLTSVTIPNSVKTIGNYAFDCSSLKTVDVKAVTPPVIKSSAFGYRTKDIEFYVPAKSLDAYLAADYWKNFNLIFK